MYQKQFNFDPNIPNQNGLHSHHPEPNPYKANYFNPSVKAVSSSAPTPISNGPIEERSNPNDHNIASVTSSYWRHNFIVAFFPLLFWGCPVHLLFGRKRITNTRQWLKSLCPCSSPCTTLLTIIMVISSVASNTLTFYTIGHFLNELVIKAEITLVLLDDLIDILRLLPVVIPLDLLWIKGFKLRKIIASFDQYNYSHSSPMGGEKLPQIPGCRMKLAILYIMIFSIHTLHLISKYYTPDMPLSGEPVETQALYTTLYSIGVMYTFIFPLYCTFCWAINYELMMLRAYIKSLIRARVPPKYAHFDEFKKSYRRVADHIMSINSMFAIYLSLIIVVLGLYIYREFESLGTTMFTTLMSTFMKGQQSQGSTTEEFMQSLSQTKVRLIVADITILLLYVCVFGLSYWQAVKTNDEVRYLHVWLNDFVTEPESRLTPELYDAFRLLKFYIHSRIEQERPALLNISIVSLVPFLSRRLLGYKVIH